MSEETNPAAGTPAATPQPIRRSHHPAPARAATSKPPASPAAPAPIREPETAPGALQAMTNGQPSAAAPAKRVPFGSQTSKLAYPARPGFVRRWFNEAPGRIDRAIEAGYTHVLSRDRKPISKGVGVRDGGGGLNGYLMEIPEELYNEDFALKQSKMDDTDETIKRGTFKAQAGDARYGDVKMTSNRPTPKRPMMGQVGAR